MAKNYSNTAATVSLSGAINASATTIAVSATTGFPAVNFALVLGPGTVNEELVLVTNVAGTNLTVVRGYDNTTAVAHDSGTSVQHSHSAEDFTLSRTHEAATAAHGATGAVVGTTNTQTLTNKTVALGSNTVTGTLAQFSTAVTDADLVGLTTAQTLTNKTLTNPTITLATLQPAVATGSVNFTSGSGNCASIVLPAGRWILMGRGRFNWSTSGNPFHSMFIYNVTGSAAIDQYDHQQISAGDQESVTMVGLVDLAGTSTVAMRATTASPGNGTQLLDMCRLVAIPWFGV